MSGDVRRWVALARAWTPVAAAWYVAALLVALQVQSLRGGVAADTHTYWLAARHGPTYTKAPGEPGAYLYSPLFTQILWPLALLPFSAFAALWCAGALCAYAWITAGAGWKWAPLLLALSLEDVRIGNANWLLALAIVAVLRGRPGAWSVVLLTKVTPGVGALWSLIHGRPRLADLAVPGAVVASSIALSPGEWAAWIRFLASQGGSHADTARLLLAVVVVVVAIRLRVVWLVPAGVALAAPVFGLYSVSLLLPIARCRDLPPGSGPLTRLRAQLDAGPPDVVSDAVAGP